AAEKVIELGGKVLTLSDSDGYIYDAEGINEEKLAHIMQLKNVERVRISNYINKYPHATFHKGERPWNVPCDIALPCATQNEISEQDAKDLITNKVKIVAEGANMPSSMAAIHLFLEKGVLFAPGKAANAGGVATSGLEMSQNSLRMSWSREEVDQKLKQIMANIHQQCVIHGKQENGTINYVVGANIAGFTKVADAMLEQGIV
ncbi:MAG: glutamate dehydrogenase, partial [Solirubrobacteraceae bacterium]